MSQHWLVCRGIVAAGFAAERRTERRDEFMTHLIPVIKGVDLRDMSHTRRNCGTIKRQRESNPLPLSILHGENGPSGFGRIRGRIPLVSRSGTVADVAHHARRRIRNPATVPPIIERIPVAGSGTAAVAPAPDPE